ncbi:MAG TPA: PQQ-binding-like beta-propeller repeat protein [Pyrinomonadaceae bacterium]|nr:PQQ-binding-like beta-propeller repeat protein [Pyrinomonadaceae bacterium]
MSENIQTYIRQSLLSTLLLFTALATCSSYIQSKPRVDQVSEKGLTFSSPLIVRWQFDSKNTTSLSPTSNNGHLYLPLTSGEIVSLNTSNGQLLWKTETGGNFSASPIADERGVYLASENDAPSNSRQMLRSTGAIRALSQSTGITLWMRTLHFPLRGGLVSSATKLFGGAADGRVYAFNKANGEIIWAIQHSGAFNSYPTLHDKRLYIGSEDGTLLALDEATGAIVWRYRTRGALRGTVAIAENIIYFGSTDGYVYAYSNLRGRLLWRRRTGAAVQAVTLSDNGIVVTSLDNFVYLLSPRRGELIWKRQLAGRIAALPLIDSRSALFAPLGGDACVVLSLRDGKQLNTLPVGEEGNTGATPLVAGDLLLIPTRRGLTAFAPSTAEGNP